MNSLPRHLGSIGLLVAMAITSGCAYSGKYAVTRCWLDRNTLREPALFVEQIDHLPSRRADVEHYRWMYNAGPGHVPAIEPAVFAPVVSEPIEAAPSTDATDLWLPPSPAPMMRDRRGGSGIETEAEDELPPAPTADAAARNIRGAWLFGERS